MAEGGGLLNRYTVNSRIVGSNPIPSATEVQTPQNCEVPENERVLDPFQVKRRGYTAVFCRVPYLELATAQSVPASCSRPPRIGDRQNRLALGSRYRKAEGEPFGGAPQLERLNQELKRRTHVVCIFTNAESCRLVRALRLMACE